MVREDPTLFKHMFSILEVCSFIRYSFCEELTVQLVRDAVSERMVSQTGRIYIVSKGRVAGREPRLQWCRAVSLPQHRAVGTGHLGVTNDQGRQWLCTEAGGEPQVGAGV